MTPRIRIKARELLAAGREFDQHELAEAAFCTLHAARKVLRRLHSVHEIHVAAWRKSGTNPLPVYAAGAGTDVPRPRAKSHAEASRDYRQRHPARVRQQGKNRKCLRVRRAQRAVQSIPDVYLILGGHHVG